MAPTPADPPLERQKRDRWQSASHARLPVAVLLPGLAFVAMGRPLPGLICYVLQASFAGWPPAAFWAVRAIRQVEQKQRVLAARLRPN